MSGSLMSYMCRLDVSMMSRWVADTIDELAKIHGSRGNKAEIGQWEEVLV